MIVAQIVDYPIGLIGGAQISTLTMGEALFKEYGISVFYICPSSDFHTSIIDNDRIYEVNTRLGRFTSLFRYPIDFMKASRDVLQILTSSDVDIVHCQGTGSFHICALSQKLKCKKVYTDRGLFSGYRVPVRLLNKYAARRVDRVITTTETNAIQWRKNAKVHVDVIPNSLPKIFDSYSQEKKSILRKDYGINDYFGISFVGRFTTVKNWPLALEIVKRLNQVRSDFCVSLALRVKRELDSEAASADAIVRKFKMILGDRLHYFENLDQLRMADFYYLSDVFVATSSFESFGRTLLEAMSRRNCVLGTSVGGIPEVVGDRELICDQNADCFVNRLCSLMNNAYLLKEKQNKLFARFKNFFSTQMIIKKQLEVYSSILEDKY